MRTGWTVPHSKCTNNSKEAVKDGSYILELIIMWWCSSIFGLKSILYSFVLRGMVMCLKKRKPVLQNHKHTFTFEVAL